MGTGVSVFMLAAGAVLTFAINASVPNANLDLIGVILMIAGGIGLLVSLAFASSRREDMYVEQRVIDRRHSHKARGT